MNLNARIRSAFNLPWVWIAAVGLLASGAFLLTSSATTTIGFPLDDAWIHQTYARNLAKLGEWAYIPGQPSAGSTAPAWSALLALGHLFTREVPFFWTFLLGIACLVGIGCLGQAIFAAQQLSGLRWPVAGMLLAGEWHLVWAAVSGMETALMGLLVLGVFWWLVQKRQSWLGTGALIGVCVWVRPDGLTLLGPALFILLLTQQDDRPRIGSALHLAAGFLILVIPYLLFNRLANGSFWPNTFYAKQAEYAGLLSQPIWERYARQLFLPMAGVGIFLLPGFIAAVAGALKERKWDLLSAGIWFLGYAAIYALRLPVTYQHGRYLMPAMPVYFLLGVIGTAALFGRIPKTRIAFVLSRAALASLAIVWLAFLGIGARAYATDVAVIQTEMVETARWVAANTPADVLIAAHDIGALGYFGGRNILDLAGLISPEVIPFIRDEGRLATYLTEKHVDYLVTFPDWYPILTRDLTPVYQGNGEFAPAAGVVNMAVYRWK